MGNTSLSKRPQTERITLSADNVPTQNVANVQERMEGSCLRTLLLNKYYKKYPWAKDWSLEALQNFEKNATPVSVNGIIRYPTTYIQPKASFQPDTRSNQQHKQAQKEAEKKLEQSKQLKETEAASEVINNPYNPIGWIPGLRTMFNVGADQQYSRYTGQNLTPYTANAAMSAGSDAMTLGFGLGPLKNYTGSYLGTIAGGVVGEQYDSPHLGQFIGGIAGGFSPQVLNYGTKKVKSLSDAFLLKDNSVSTIQARTDLGLPLSQEQTRIAGRIAGGGTSWLDNRPFYSEVDPDLIKTLPEYNFGITKIADTNELIGNRVRLESENYFPIIEEHFNLLDFINKQHRYGLDVSKFPRHHYQYDRGLGTFEYPKGGEKGLPVVARGSSVNDVMYSHGHNIWDALPKEVKAKLEIPFSRIWRNVPMDPGYSPGSRAYPVVSEIRSMLYNRFLKDNRFKAKSYEEWEDYVEDYLHDIQLANYIKKVHGGHWYEEGNLDIKQKTLDAIREALKYNNGGKFKNRFKNF